MKLPRLTVRAPLPDPRPAYRLQDDAGATRVLVPILADGNAFELAVALATASRAKEPSSDFEDLRVALYAVDLACTIDALNPCLSGRPQDVPGRHWGGGSACAHCTVLGTLNRIFARRQAEQRHAAAVADAVDASTASRMEVRP